MKPVTLIRIYCEESRENDLFKLGVGVGNYNTYENCFTKCIVPKHVIPKLKKKYKFCLEDSTDGCWYA